MDTSTKRERLERFWLNRMARVDTTNGPQYGRVTHIKRGYTGSGVYLWMARVEWTDALWVTIDQLHLIGGPANASHS